MIKILILSKAGSIGRPFRFHTFSNKAFLVLQHSFSIPGGLLFRYCLSWPFSIQSISCLDVTSQLIVCTNYHYVLTEAIGLYWLIVAGHTEVS